MSMLLDYVDTFLNIWPWLVGYSVTYSLLIIAIIEDSKRCKKIFIEEDF